MTNTPLDTAALDYATRRQWATFPCKPHTKTPATPHGFKDASADPAQIAAWAKQYPGANVAFEPGRHGLAVVDFDRTDGPAGDLLRRLDATAPTLRAKSPTGGPHRFYRLPPGETLPSTQNTPCPGVDIRSTGGYVLLDPSEVTYTGKDAIKKGVPDGYTGAYEFTNDLEPALIPTWLLQALRTPQRAPAAPTVTTQAPARTHKDDLATIGDAAAALGHLAAGRCDDYASWIATGQALQELGPMGLGLWDTWSRKSAKYEEGVCARKWATFKRTGRALHTLYTMAELDSPGYQRPGNGDAAEHGHPPDDDDPPPDAPMPGTRSLREVADDLQAWALESEFAGKLRAADVKRLDGPRAVYVALCTLARRHNTMTLQPGLRGLGELAGMSHESVRANLGRLAAAGMVDARVCDERLTVCVLQGGTTVNLSSHIAGETYAASVADDAFTTYPMKWAQIRRPGIELEPGMGRGAAVPWAYMLADGGQWTARRLSEAAGMTTATARTSLKRLEAAGLATVSRAKAFAPNVYTLIDDAAATLDALRPTMATFGSNARRALNNALQAGAWAYRNAQSGAEWQRPRQEARQKRADGIARKWAQHLEAAGIDWRVRVQPPKRYAVHAPVDLGKPKRGEAQRLVDHARLRVAAIRQAWEERTDALQAMDDVYWGRIMSAPQAMDPAGAWAAD